jgi:toxin-antitoxin system PIN domain toxin
VNHEPAHAWLSANRRNGWATCPITENGLVRILSNAAYSGVHESSAAIRDRLDSFCASGDHVFWGDEISLRDQRLFTWPASVTHRQVTDVYLLALARYKRGRLATFDRRIPLGAVVGARREHLEVIDV